MGEVFDLLAVRADETSVRIVIELVESSVGLRMASHGGSEIRFEGDDLFECLINARLELESRGLLLCCQGCRPDVFPSGMHRQMNDLGSFFPNGRKARYVRPFLPRSFARPG
jgi:hypothetical protein